MKYALDIYVGSKHYQSAFVAPEYTPEIDSLSWKLNNDDSIDIMVSTHDPDNKTLYCLWNFEENWEIRSLYQAPVRYSPDSDAVITQSPTGDNRYYCWDSDYSKSLLLASTEKYNEAVVKDHKIHQLKPGNSRYSYLYSILVRQFRLDREASIYFNNLQRNIDESGSLFAPLPSEISGNIQCLSDPDEPVIGYIFVSKAATSRLYIPMDQQQLNYLEDISFCLEGQQFDNPRTAYYQDYGIYNADEDGEEYFYTYRKCVDCTLRGGTKSKPDFWPNDHR
jgi:hypothetical protein